MRNYGCNDRFTKDQIDALEKHEEFSMIAVEQFLDVAYGLHQAAEINLPQTAPSGEPVIHKTRLITGDISNHYLDFIKNMNWYHGWIPRTEERKEMLRTLSKGKFTINI